MKKLNLLGLLLTITLCQLTAYTQSSASLISNYLVKTSAEKGWNESDITNWEITDDYTSKNSGVQHVYIRQMHQGIPLYMGVANFNIKNGIILNSGLRLAKNISQKVNTTIATITPFDAIVSAAKHFELKTPTQLKIIETVDTKNFLIEANEISLENIPVQLMYFQTSNENQEIRLVWDLSIYEKSKNHWWSVRVDAVSGEVLDQVDWVVSCTFESCDHSEFSHSSRRPIPEISLSPTPAPPPGTDAYRVFAIPAESPNHGPRTLVVGPSNPVASPYGWHDTNGLAGPEFLTTEGNNVRATEDMDDNDGVGFFPNGGATLNFDFPLNFNNAPSTNLNPAITNLFYMNNVMHDIWYQYGFDEVSGNFQENAYGNGGLASDNVWAEAQDGGGTNNANFATPGDGGNPRMQMYLWSPSSSPQNLLTVNSPAGIAGQYSATEANFGPGAPATPLTGNLVLVNDGTPAADEGCNALTNGVAIAGNIAVVMRGNCSFVIKVINAQNAGATAVIVINNVPGAPIAMGGVDPNISIPSIMISDVDGALLLAQLSGGINATIQSAGAAQALDGDFDNGIIAHEYGHGISNRLTGGPSNSGCLSNAEQMGEGWSDWFGLMLTIEPGDLGPDVRGIGTYATGAPITGNGIRPTPYSTNMGINPSTYATSNNASISQPHGIGYVWCTMIWDLNWALISQYGFNSDLYNGTGGNNIAMHLIIEGLKMQPCSSGFVDGRDAILAADMALYGGANQCLIWTVFANRGLGYSASQGSSSSRSDQVEAFDLPISCQTPTQAPIADFSFVVNNCNGDVSFTDLSIQVPQSWSWTFGDGGTSTLQNPTHNYTQNGTYFVILITSNNIGSDTISYSVSINMLLAPTVSNSTICYNTSATLTGSASGSIIWYNSSGTIPLDTTTTFTTPVLTTNTSYMVENVEFEPIQYVGPLNDAFGTSGYHNPTIDFTLNFTSNSTNGFTILSVWIDANTVGPRTINVWDAANAAGTIIGTTTVNITSAGP